MSADQQELIVIRRTRDGRWTADGRRVWRIDDPKVTVAFVVGPEPDEPEIRHDQGLRWWALQDSNL